MRHEVATSVTCPGKDSVLDFAIEAMADRRNGRFKVHMAFTLRSGGDHFNTQIYPSDR